MMKEKKLSALLLVSMVLLLSYGTTVSAYAAVEKNVAGLGTGAIKSPEPGSADNDWTGSYVWYGAYNGNAVRYRVLTPETTAYGEKTMLLDCDTILFKEIFDTAEREWNNSHIRDTLNGSSFLEKEGVFTKQEKNAIELSSSPAKNVDSSDYDSLYSIYKVSQTTALNAEKIFLLDYEEILNPSFGYASDSGAVRGKDPMYKQIWNHVKKFDGEKDWWCLRSVSKPEWSPGKMLGNVTSVGDVCGFESYSNRECGISPAFNIDLNSVLFTSAVSGAVGKNRTEYKLTLMDNSLTIKTTGDVVRSDKTITIPYNASGNFNRISVFMTDKAYTESGASVKYYEELSDSKAFILPDGYSDSWKTYIIAEQVNGEKETDYASIPVGISIPRKKDSSSEDSQPAPSQAGIPKKGTSLVDKYGTNRYRVTSAKSTDPCVAYTGSSGKQASIIVPNTVTINGITYKVTSIAPGACKRNKKLKKVTIGTNVKEIGKKAFYGCTKLTTVNCKSKVLSKIGASVFQGDKKLTKITLKTTLLKKTSTVGKNAFKGTSAKLMIKVPSKVKKTYKKFFKKKGNKKVTIK